MNSGNLFELIFGQSNELNFVFLFVQNLLNSRNSCIFMTTCMPKFTFQSWFSIGFDCHHRSQFIRQFRPHISDILGIHSMKLITWLSWYYKWVWRYQPFSGLILIAFKMNRVPQQIYWYIFKYKKSTDTYSNF